MTFATPTEKGGSVIVDSESVKMKKVKKKLPYFFFFFYSIVREGKIRAN